MLIRIPASPQGKLIRLPPALHGYLLKIFQAHILRPAMQPVLVTFNSSLLAQPLLPMRTMPHNAHIQQFREGSHKGIPPRILPILYHARTEISARSLIKKGYKVPLSSHLHRRTLITEIPINDLESLPIRLFQQLE